MYHKKKPETLLIYNIQQQGVGGQDCNIDQVASSY